MLISFNTLALEKAVLEAADIAVINQQPNANLSYRKNIDDLTPSELAAYKHAVKMLKIKSERNVFDRTGFMWQSWVHNCPSVDVVNSRKAVLSAADMENYLLRKPSPDSCKIETFLTMPNGTETHAERPGECEHRKDTFLQWHRAQLYFYEKALQASDPNGEFGPSTKNVALPYWNFPQKPSGIRYPKAFEDSESPLFDKTRNPDGLDSALPTTSPYLLAYILYFNEWADFGGDEYGSNSGGNLETKIHNQMHASYIAGHMADNATAALDPIFYVFHNFLDYSFEKWIEVHGTDHISGGQEYLRGEQDDSLPNPQGFTIGSRTKIRKDSGAYLPNMGQAQLYFDTKKQGFAFHSGRYDDFIPKADIQHLIDQHQAAGFVFGDNKISLFSALLSYGSSGVTANPKVKLAATYTIPKLNTRSPAKLLLNFKRNRVLPDYSFQADVYLYPVGTPEDIANKEFRDRYLVTNTVHWGLSGAHADHEISINMDITNIINSLVNTRHGEKWQVTLALSGSDPQAINAGDFSNPIITTDPGKQHLHDLGEY